MNQDERPRLRDPRLDRLSRRVELLLWLVVPIAAWQAVASPGFGRLIWGPWAVGLALMLGMHRVRGGPMRTLLQWISGLVGLALVLGGLALLAFGILLLTRGSFGILGGLAAVPISMAVSVWGAWLLFAALADPERDRRFEVDLEAARRSPAVQRFDALHGPRGGETAGESSEEDAPSDGEPPVPPGGIYGVSGS